MLSRYHLIAYLALAFAFGIFIAFQTNGLLTIFALIGFSIGVVIIFRKPIVVAIIIAFLLTGFLLGALQSNLQLNDPVKQYFGKKTTVQGLVVSDVIKKNRLYSYEISVNKLNNIDVSSYVKIYGDKVKTGNQIQVKATVKPPLENNQLTTLFSYSKSKVLGENRFWAAIGTARQWVKESILKDKSDSAIFTFAMLTGQIADLSPIVKSDLQASGLAHLWSVSGIHTGFLVLLIILLFRIANLRAGWQFLLIVISLSLFSAFSGFQAPVIRASIMASWLSAAYLLGRKRNWLPSLSAAALLSLAINPSALFNASFQLSYATMASLLAFPKLIGGLIKEIPSKIKGPLSVSIAAQILPLPLIAYYYGQIPIFSVLANVLVMPLAALSFYFAIIGLLFNAVGFGWLIKVATFFSSVILLIARFFNGLPVSTLSVTPWMLLAFALLITSVFLAIFFKKPKKLSVKFATIVIILLAVFAVAQWWPTANTVIDGKRLTVEFLDVGQGDAALITGPQQEKILIDSGPKAYLIQQHLLKRKVNKLDLVVATHADADHIAGLPQVLKNFKVRAVLDNGYPKRSYFYKQFLATVKSKKIRYVLARKGQAISVGSLRLTVLNPPSVFFKDTQSDDNSNSIVIKLKYYKTNFLFTADATFDTEHRLAAPDGLQSVILKVAHHGSAGSTSASFLQKVQPKVAIISAGRHNNYGHPKATLLARLRRARARIYRTDLSSDIKVVANENGWHIYP